MKVIFIGTVELSWQCLKVIKNYTDVKAIFTYNPIKKINISGFKSFDDFVDKYNIKIYYIDNINSEENINIIKVINPEAIFCIGWPQLINKSILEIPINKSFGIHSSLLPKYRGGAPVNWGLINGEKKWGITLMYLGAKADNGDIIDQISFNINLDDNVKTVYDKVAEASINILNKNLPRIIKNTIVAKKQNENLATKFNKRNPDDGEIDWNRSSNDLYNWIRALTHPYPGSFTYINDSRKIYIWDSEIYDYDPTDEIPGTLIKIIPYKGILVKCGKGSLLVKRVQLENDLEMSAVVWALNYCKKLKDILFISQ